MVKFTVLRWVVRKNEILPLETDYGPRPAVRLSPKTNKGDLLVSTLSAGYVYD